MSQNKNRIRINHEIRVPKVRVIDPEGNQVGVLETREAQRLADETYGLDLVEISPTASPPVCKIIDAGKFKYQLKKKAQEAKKHQNVVLIKEVKFRPQTDKHDIDFKLKHITRFLNEGHKIKLTVFFKGREMAYKELGLNMLRRVFENFNEVANIEQQPKAEGRYMTMVIAPKKEWLEAQRKKKNKSLKPGEKKMPKMKTNRGAAKRIKVTKSGKMKRAKAFGSHILTKKSRKRKRQLKKTRAYVDSSNARKVKRLLPYA